MTRYVVTTFGPWEEQRRRLVEQLLADKAIFDYSPNITEDSINKALCDNVHTLMYRTMRKYPGVDRLDLTDRSREILFSLAYRQSLSKILPTLVKTLHLPIFLIEHHVNQFTETATFAIDFFIADIVKIRNLSMSAVILARDSLYGQKFTTMYPDELVQGLVSEDKQIAIAALESISSDLQPSLFSNSEHFIREVLKYMLEIARQQKASTEYQQYFAKITGLTMSAFKDRVQQTSALRAKSVCNLRNFSLLRSTSVDNLTLPSLYDNVVAATTVQPPTTL